MKYLRCSLILLVMLFVALQVAQAGGNNCCLAPVVAKPEVKPVIGNWVKNMEIAKAVRVHSPLIADVIEGLAQMAPADLACSSLRGKVIDRSTGETSKHTIITNAAGTVTVITLYTRSSDQEDKLSVHVEKGVWVLYREVHTTGDDDTNGDITLLAKGQFDPKAPIDPGAAGQVKDLLKDKLDIDSGAVKGGRR